MKRPWIEIMRQRTFTALTLFMTERYVDALSALYWLSLRIPTILALSMITVTITASAAPPRSLSPISSLSVRATRAEPRSLSLARCWVGVIDQINPPWISVVGERGEAVSVSVDHAYPEAREGDWVLYWTRTHTLESLQSAETLRERERLKSDLLELYDESTLELTL